MSATIQSYLPMILDGAAVTIAVAVLAFIGSLIIGLLGAFGSTCGGRSIRRLIKIYTTLIRGVPDLVLMLLCYFGGQTLLNQLGTATGLWDYIEISAFGAGTATMAFIFGAYMTETFRGAAIAIPGGFIEAGLALGLSRRRLFTRIIWPQLLRYALPGIGNNWQVLMKATALVSVIGLQDMVFNSLQAGRTTRHVFVFMGIVLIIYLIITMISAVVLSLLSRHFNRNMARGDQ